MQNTCAGVARLRTFGRIAMVRATGTMGRQEHLKLLFVDDEGNDEGIGGLDAKAEYG
jgi:hypothetical protein